MVIDLNKCSGCGACALACKTENNTQDRRDGQSFNWADYQHEEKGTFPNIDYVSRPVLCNHCSDAACINVCPETPKAMFKTKNGATLFNEKRCIGCARCQKACPYSKKEVKQGEWSVISMNDEDEKVYPEYRKKKALIKGCTSSGAEVAKKAGVTPPMKTKYTHPDFTAARRAGVIEKCTFCHHRVENGMEPYCVVSCPSGARTFGDATKSSSKVAKLLKKYKASVLKPEEKTVPNVHYIRSFKAKS